MTFRHQKRRARLQLHHRLADPVLYLKGATADPKGVMVRLHLGFDTAGELRRAGFAETHEYDPRAVFLAAEVTPVVNGIIVTEDMGAWRVTSTLPPDDITITAEVARLSRSQIQNQGWDPDALWLGFPPPSGAPPVEPGYDYWEAKEW